MANDLVEKYGNWILLIVVLGSLVDLIQFSWLVKRSIRKTIRRVREQLKKEILWDELNQLRKDKNG